MATAQAHPVIRYVRQLAASHLAAALSDAQLLERFSSGRDEAAFAALVWRHGPLVLGVCRRVLHDWHAAEDAFQATFVVLARKAGSLRRPEALGPWLYGVASRTALKARAREARRRAGERQAAVAGAVEHPDDLVWRDLRPVLDEAVGRLPDKYRVPFILHHLHGLTVAEVARRLGCPQGTVAARLARARGQLRSRLARRGLALSAGVFLLGLSRGAGAAVPAPLLAGTVEAATLVAAGKAAGVASATAAALTKGVLQAMFLNKLKVAAAVFLAVSAVGVGVGLPGHGMRGPGREGAVVGGGVVGNNSPNKDVQVTVQEANTGSLLFGMGVNSDAGPTGSIMFNERNFDITRPPTSVDDILNGTAFRGAGQELRIEAVPGTQLQRYTIHALMMSRTVLPLGIMGRTCSW
jgi:RNA polymerase sigma factor (sigma-70 family)